MVEEGTYRVTLTAVVEIRFSPIERPTALTASDGIGNAMGTMPVDTWSTFEDEGWSLAWSAERIDLR